MTLTDDTATLIWYLSQDDDGGVLSFADSTDGLYIEVDGSYYVDEDTEGAIEPRVYFLVLLNTQDIVEVYERRYIAARRRAG